MGGEEHTVEDVSAKAIEDVTAWDTHFALKPAAAVYKNLVINPTTSSIDTPEDGAPLPNLEDADGSGFFPEEAEEENEGERSFVEKKSYGGGGVAFIPFTGFEDWIKAQKPVYTVVYWGPLSPYFEYFTNTSY